MTPPRRRKRKGKNVTPIINGVPCFTTKTGLQIGCLYTPPPQPDAMTREGEFWQKRLLPPGIAPLPMSYEVVVDVAKAVAIAVFALSMIYALAI